MSATATRQSEFCVAFAFTQEEDNTMPALIKSFSWGNFSKDPKSQVFAQRSAGLLTEPRSHPICFKDIKPMSGRTQELSGTNEKNRSLTSGRRKSFAYYAKKGS